MCPNLRSRPQWTLPSRPSLQIDTIGLAIKKALRKLQYDQRIGIVRVSEFYEFRNVNPLILRATVKKSQKLGGIRNVKT